MWNPQHTLRLADDTGTRRDSRNMATRRRLVRGKVTFAVFGIAVLVLMLGGSVFVSNQVTSLRAGIARLEDRQEFLEAGSALLLTEWNHETSAEVLIPRASRGGFVLSDKPDLVLVEADPAGQDRAGALRRFIGRLGVADEANAAEIPAEAAAGTMVSLRPRRQADGGRP